MNNELRVAALSHAIECYGGPDDDTLPVLRHWLRELTSGAMCACGCPTEMHVGEIGCTCGLPGEPPCQPAGSHPMTAPAVCRISDRPHFVIYDPEANEPYSCDACLYRGAEPPPLPCAPALGLHGDLALHNHHVDRAKSDYYGNPEEPPC